MSKYLRRWAGRTGNALASDTTNNAAIQGGTPPVFGKEAGETYLRWSQASGVNGFLVDQFPASSFLQMTFDIRVTAQPAASIIFGQCRSTVDTAAGNMLLYRNSTTTRAIGVRDGSDGQVTASTANVNLNQWVRVQAAWQSATQMTTAPYDGKTKARITDIATGALLTSGETLTGHNKTAYYRHHIGKLSTANSTYIDIKNVVLGNEAYAFLDPPEFVWVDGQKRIVTSKSVIVNGQKVSATGYFRIVNGAKVPVT